MSTPQSLPTEPQPPTADHTLHSPIDRTQSVQRRVLNLAAPVIGENLLQTMLGIVDTILVAGLGAVALAGVGSSLQVVFILTAALSALSVGASVLVAQATGAGNMARASLVARQAMLWSAIVALPITFVGLFFSHAIIGIFGLGSDVALVAEEYLRITLGTVATLTIMLIGSGVMRGAGDSRTPMLVTLLANVINVVLAWSLIYGHLGMPRLGVAGSAWGTFGSRLVGALIVLAVLWRGVNGMRIGGGGDWWPRWVRARELLQIGLPAALEEVIIISAFAALTPIVARLGTEALAAHRVAINVLSLAFLPGIGFSLASTALVGQAIGAGDPRGARQAVSVAMRWAVAWMGTLGVIFLFFSPQLMQIFTEDGRMVTSGAGAIQIVAIAQPLWAGTFVFAGALRGTGDTRTPLLISGISVWIIVVISYILAHFWPSLTAIWGAFLVIGPIETFLLWRAWRRRQLA